MGKKQPGVMVALAAAISAPAIAQDREADWLKRPTPETLRSVFPVAALRKGRSGSAAISCIATVQGALRDCKVVSESPADMGFGGAGLALAPQLLMRPAMRGGAPVESTVTIPINWDLSGLGPRLTSSKSSRVYTNLPFQRAPTVEQVLAAHPEKARAAKVGGMAVIDCRIGPDGGLSKCRTIREQPANYGFARAAKSLAPLFTTPINTPDGGTAEGSRAHVNVTFAASGLEGASRVIGRPKWAAVPRITDMAAVLPATARSAMVYKARVVMRCKVVAEGGVEGCTVTSQEPEGLGYDQAALSLTKFFRLAVWTEEGLPAVGGEVTIPLRFELESAATPPAGP